MELRCGGDGGDGGDVLGVPELHPLLNPSIPMVDQAYQHLHLDQSAETANPFKRELPTIIFRLIDDIFILFVVIFIILYILNAVSLAA